MVTLRLATFNCENLFARFRFNKNIEPTKAVRDGWNANEVHFEIFDEATKRITGDVISSLDADIIAFQEVENHDTLKRFRDQFIRRGNKKGRAAYPHSLVIDGNDPRLIDVAIMSIYPIVNVRSYQHERTDNGKDWLFSRDCLVADIEAGTKTLTLFVNHFKSMLDKKDAKNGRRNTRAKREAQANRCREIVEERLGKKPGGKPFVVLGDLNDYMQEDEQGKPGIGPIVEWNQVENVVDRLPEEERWTHFFARRKAYHQIDYLLPSRSIADASPDPPEIVRTGMPLAATRYTGERHPQIEQAGAANKDKRRAASDHCPVVFGVRL
ncbi:MAG TPA: endonuclease/exonuclease/phosphatase family protein [Alphaproteobacteria bacterium]|jgi:endonuclease/exonuclease/phosphatase family metal-dependent hydrolase